MNNGGNAQYTSHRIADESLEEMTADIEQTVIRKIRKTPAYSIMTDVATDVSNRKHLVFVVKYVDDDTGEVNINYLNDVQIDNGLVVTVFKVVIGGKYINLNKITKI